MARITNEAEWMACNDPVAITWFTHGDPRASPDQGWFDATRFRYLAVEWVRRIRPLFSADDLRLVDTFEAWVSGRGSDPSIEADAFGRITLERLGGPRHRAEATWCADWMYEGFTCKVAAHAALAVANVPTTPLDTYEERVRQRERQEAIVGAEFCDQFRDVAGNPFRPVTFRPKWRDETVSALARTIDEGGRYEALPILADALEEAGCDLPAMLDHCRGEGPHVRGCWVIDMIRHGYEFRPL